MKIKKKILKNSKEKKFNTPEKNKSTINENNSNNYSRINFSILQNLINRTKIPKLDSSSKRLEDKNATIRKPFNCEIMDLRILSNDDSEYLENQKNVILKNNQIPNFNRLKSQRLKTVNYSNLSNNNFDKFKERNSSRKNSKVSKMINDSNLDNKSFTKNNKKYSRNKTNSSSFKNNNSNKINNSFVKNKISC
jgi:hypothetical protein